MECPPVLQCLALKQLAVLPDLFPILNSYYTLFGKNKNIFVAKASHELREQELLRLIEATRTQ